MSGKQSPGRPQPIKVVEPAEPYSIAPLRQRAGSFAAACGAHDDLIADVKLAVSEAATNVVKYAYDAADEGVVELSVAVKDRWLLVRVGDEGKKWFEGPSTGLGLGVTIIARLCESVKIIQEGKGTKVLMRFELPAT
jgi:serine/threonine-protein kinase RsbW